MSYNLTTTALPSLLQTYLPDSLHRFVLLSYPLPTSLDLLTGQPLPTLYDKGPDDAYYVAFWAIAFTVLREVCLTGVFSPVARFLLPRTEKIKGQEREYARAERKREHTVLRFAEQGWSWLYCSIFWTYGVVVLNQFPNPFSPEQIWGTYPVIHTTALTKFYYLAQLGWWFHQIAVINFEKRRKDHWQMFAHHILTIALVVTSYLQNFTRVGVVCHWLMDFCDILLPLAKMLRYVGLTTLCDIAFVFFLISWFVTRQVGLFLVVKSVYDSAPNFIPLIWAPDDGIYFSPNAYRLFLGMLSTLWVMATAWFYMACMVALRVIRGEGAEDSRSDDESEGADLLDEVPESVGTGSNVKIISVPVGKDDLRKRR